MRETTRARRLSLALSLGIAAGVLFDASAASAQSMPPVARTSDSGYEGRVNATGGYSTSIPLDLPATRDGLAIPLAIVSGGHVAGAAGLGWDVPLSYVRVDNSIAKRKPLDALTLQGRERVTLSIAGMNIDLVRHNYDPNNTGPEYWLSRRDQTFFSAVQNGTSWTVYDGEGHRYEFATAGVDADAGLALLKTVWDSAGNQLMGLDYDARNVAAVSGRPPQTFSVDLKSISYNFRPDGGCAKDEIDLAYDDSRANPIAASALSGHLYFRDHVLSSVKVQSRGSCVAATTLRTYNLVYDGFHDADTGLPRLQKVQVYGRGETEQNATPLTLASYTYNRVVDTYPNALVYQGVTSTTAMPVGTQHDGISREVVMSQSTSDRTWYATTQDLLDMTGDGIPDFVYLSDGLMVIARGSANVGGGITFATPQTLGDGSVQITQGLRIHAVGHDHLEDGDIEHDGDYDSGYDHGLVTYDRDRVWRMPIDVNGDGRMDIVDAQEEDNHWTVYLNTPSTGASGLTWAKRSIPISALLGALSAHDRGDGVHLELKRGFTSQEVEVNNTSESITHVGTQVSYVEWDLRDVNGDGLPDFVFDDHPASFHQIRTEQDAWTYTPGLNRANQLEVAFDVGGVTLSAAPGGAQMIYGNPVSILDHATICGIELWEGGEMSCALVDLTGDGILDRIEYDSSRSVSAPVHAWAGLGASFSPLEIPFPREGALGLLPGAFGTTADQCATNSSSFSIHSVDWLVRDVTGDGIPDLVGTNEVYVGTGFGFRPDALPTHGMFISWQQVACDGGSKTIEGIYDVDGDGRPEQVSIDGGGNLNIVVPTVDDAPAAIGSGKIARVDNAYGASTSITYRSAKEDSLTPHQVAFPEVVVSSVHTTAPSQPASATTYYAYGKASMLFDNVAGGFVFPGYHRTVVMTTYGTGTDAAGAVILPSGAPGQAVITDTKGEAAFQPGMTDDQRFARRMLVGRVVSVARLSGNLGIDPYALMGVVVTSDARVDALTLNVYQSKLYTEPNGPNEGVLDCLDIVDPYDYDASLAYVGNVYDTCSAHGFAYEWWSGSAHGSLASTAHTTTRTQVNAVDDHARPTEVFYSNDTTRADDDLCIDTTYATSIGLVPVLDAKATHKTSTACGIPGASAPAMLGYETYQYDNYPTGTVSLGRTTSMTAERHAADDGTLLAPTIHVFDASYDAVGNPTTVISVRNDGSLKQTTYSYDAFGLAPTTKQVAATGLTNMTTSTTYDVAMNPLTVTDANGSVSSFVYDDFDRAVQVSVAPHGGAAGVVATTSYLGFTDGTGRRIVSKTFDDPVADPTSVAGHQSTTYLDERGRAVRTESSLGSDYGNQVLVRYDTFDPFGRLLFASEPFVGTDDPATAMGTTHFYKVDGFPDCDVRARGPHDYTPVTSTLSDVYATCYYHAYLAGTEIVGSSAPDANEPGTAQYGRLELRTATAIGLPLTQYKDQGGAPLEYSAYANDRLGNVASLTRYKVVSPLGSPVTTSWRYDNAGQKFAEQEPEAALQSTTYDSWGNPTLTSWVDAGTTKEIATTYDALGRITHREERNASTVDPESVFDYAYDAPYAVSSEVTPTNVLGRLSRATGPASTVYFSYDGHGRVNGRTDVDPSGNRYIEKTTQHANGNVAAVDLYAADTSYKNEHVTYLYDSAGRAADVTYQGPTSSASLYKAVTVNALGQVLEAELGTETNLQATYDTSARRLLRETDVTSSYGKRTFKYLAYDAVGRDTADAEVNSDEGETDASHIFDALGRLVNEKRNGAHAANWTYTYDPLGNMLASDNSLVATEGMSIRLDTVDEDRPCGIHYKGSTAPTRCLNTFDAVGNMTSEALRVGSRTLGYFNDGGVKSISSDYGHAEFRYSPLGGVQEVNVSGTTGTRDSQHYGDVFEARNDTNGLESASYIARNIAGPGFTASLRGTKGQWVIAFGDSHGMRFTTDLDGRFVQDVSYTPFGKASSSGSSLGSASYSNEQWNGGDALESIGLVNVGARVYDPTIGRFLSRDPVRRIASANAANPYAFADNDPINESDPSGLCPDPETPCDDSGGGGGVGDASHPKGNPVDPGATPNSVAPAAFIGPPETTSYGDGAGNGSYGDDSENFHRRFVPGGGGKWTLNGLGRGLLVGTLDLLDQTGEIVALQNPFYRPVIGGVFGGRSPTQRLASAIALPAGEQDDSYSFFEFVPLLVGVFATDGESLAVDADPLISFAHGTGEEFAFDIVENGLSYDEARAASGGGLEPGSFFAHRIGPPGAAGEGFQMAYEWGVRKAADPVVLIGHLPRSVFQQLMRAGAEGELPMLREIEVPYGPVPQLIFRPTSFATVNEAVQWQIVRPGVR